MYGTGGYGEGSYGGPSSPEELSEEELIQSINELRESVQEFREGQTAAEERLDDVGEGINKLIQDDSVDTTAWILFALQVAYTAAVAEGVHLDLNVVIVFAIFWLAYWSAPSQ